LPRGPGLCVAPATGAFEQALLQAGGRISRDGRGRATDNAFVERLWRSLQGEGVSLTPAEDGQPLDQQLPAYFTYYNHHRPHQALKGQTPASTYSQTPTFNLEQICLTSLVEAIPFLGSSTIWQSWTQTLALQIPRQTSHYILEISLISKNYRDWPVRLRMPIEVMN
jgi:hypothetical protein